MTNRHLTAGAMLQEYLGSPRRGRTLLNHVRYCAPCQGVVRAARLSRLEAYPPQGCVANEHIDAATLHSFATEQLNDDLTMRVLDHLSACEDCLAGYRELHQRWDSA